MLTPLENAFGLLESLVGNLWVLLAMEFLLATAYTLALATIAFFLFEYINGLFVQFFYGLRRLALRTRKRKKRALRVFLGGRAWRVTYTLLLWREWAHQLGLNILRSAAWGFINRLLSLLIVLKLSRPQIEAAVAQVQEALEPLLPTDLAGAATLLSLAASAVTVTLILFVFFTRRGQMARLRRNGVLIDEANLQLARLAPLLNDLAYAYYKFGRSLQESQGRRASLRLREATDQRVNWFQGGDIRVMDERSPLSMGWLYNPSVAAEDHGSQSVRDALEAVLQALQKISDDGLGVIVSDMMAPVSSSWSELGFRWSRNESIENALFALFVKLEKYIDNRYSTFDGDIDFAFENFKIMRVDEEDSELHLIDETERALLRLGREVDHLLFLQLQTEVNLNRTLRHISRNARGRAEDFLFKRVHN